MRPILGSAAFLFLITISACSNPLDINDFTWRFVSQQKSAEVTSHLDGRVFRQFDPSRTADTRKAIVIDFNDGLALRAQHFEGGAAVDEWSVSQSYYWIEKAHGHPVYRFDFRDPTVERQVPEGGDSVIVTGLTILVRDYFKKDEIQFALLDSLAHLPPPFPVFDQWTRFVEDAAGR
jgi:hypothetical protein